MDLDMAVASGLRASGVYTQTASSSRWLTSRGHLNTEVRRHAPVDVLEALDEIHASLGGSRRALARLSDTPLRPSLSVAATGQHFAIDDVGHLTSDRLRTFEHYPASTAVGFNLDSYRQLIEAWRRRASAALSRRYSPDFDFVGGRRARRAYEDAVRDLLTPIFVGLPLLRVASPDNDITSVTKSLGLRLATVR